MLNIIIHNVETERSIEFTAYLRAQSFSASSIIRALLRAQGFLNSADSILMVELRAHNYLVSAIFLWT